jgi:RimJ/RimL family protein N-acetyltransferase
MLLDASSISPQRRRHASGRSLTDAAFGLSTITHVEIHHDRANQASSGVPRKLGYQLVGEAPDEPVAPAEVGVSYLWRMTRDEWQRRKNPMPA